MKNWFRTRKYLKVPVIMLDGCAAYFWAHSNGCGLLMENMTECRQCTWCCPRTYGTSERCKSESCDHCHR